MLEELLLEYILVCKIVSIKIFLLQPPYITYFISVIQVKTT